MSAIRQSSRPDPLLNVVHSYPQEALWFVKTVTLFGSLSGVLVSIPCCIFLSMYWTPCGNCNRPLRYWILIHCMLQLLQAPVRMKFYFSVCRAPNSNGDLLEFFQRLTASSAWRGSKIVSVATYGWFILGVVWLLNSTHCRICPGLYKLCCAVVFTAVARLLMTLIVFYHTFQQNADEVDPPKVCGASQNLIDALPLERFSASTCCETSCAVCLCDFQGGDMLRRLPCRHSFHRACVDKWLMHKKVCPLCVQDVEVLSQQQTEMPQAQASESTCYQRLKSTLASCATVSWRGHSA
jgi:hypothetical protein